LDRLAIAAIRDVKGKDTRRSAGAQMLKNGALDCGLRTLPAVTSAAGHGSCARLLAADGPKLGKGRRPDLGIGAQDERLAAELDPAQSAGAYLLIRRLTADPVRITKVFERQSRSMHF